MLDYEHTVGAAGNLPPGVYAALAEQNPNSTPLDYSKAIGEIRSKVASAVACTSASPRLVIDEGTCRLAATACGTTMPKARRSTPVS